MNTYLAILRGINVSGQKMIKMTELKNLFEHLQFESVRTYIQSGNVLFDSKNSDHDDMTRRIEQAIASRFGFEVPVLIRSQAELEQIVARNPFLTETEIDPAFLHVTLLADAPAADRLDAIRQYDYAPDRFQIVGREVYLYCPGGYGNTKLSNTFFENKLKVRATTRNWKTVNELVRMAHVHET